MPLEFETLVIKKVFDIALAAGEQVVDTKDIVTEFQQTLTKIRAQEPCTTGYQHRFSISISHLFYSEDTRPAVNSTV